MNGVALAEPGMASQEKAVPAVHEVAPDAPAVEGDTVLVARYAFDGQWPLPEAEMKEALKDYLGKPATFSDLEALAGRLTRLLRAKGYFVATAYIPQQDFAAGTVRFSVTPGSYGEIVIENKTGAAESVLRRELRSVKKGYVIQRKNLERGILIAGDLPRTEIKTYLKAGKEQGTSDLVLQAERKGGDFWGYAGFDNGGYRYTGKYQYSLFMNYANPFHAGDLLSLGGVASTQADGMWSGSVTYLTPLLTQGLKLGISYGRSHYALGGPYESLDYTGQSDTLGAWLQYSLHRSKPSNVYATVRYDSKKLRDGSAAYDLTNPKRAHNWTFGINGDSEDKWHGGGRNTYGLTYTNGSLSIKDATSRMYDDMTTQTAGHFGKYNLSLTRLQRLSERSALFLSYQRQWAEKNLDSSEKLSLGGPYGVRAYPIGEASGDDGWLWSAEYRYTLPNEEGASDIWQLIAFADGGRVKLYHKNYAAYAGDDSRSLYGAGIGVNWSRNSQWVGRVHYAWRVGPEHAQSDTDSRGRLWFQLYRLF